MSMERFDSMDSNTSDYEICCRNGSCPLPFDPQSLESLILNISDCFDFRVVMGQERVTGAMLVTSGLAIAGGLIGRHYGGKVGAAVGTAVGGACGLGLVVVSMREVWDTVKGKLAELFDIVYDYLAGLGIEDYRKAALMLTRGDANAQELVLVMVQVASDILGKKVLSSLTAA